MRPLSLAALLCVLAACPSPARGPAARRVTPAPRPVTPAPRVTPAPARPAAAHRAPRPKLVVLLVLDQWPEWAFEIKRPALRGGFARLLAEGQWRVGPFPSAATQTAPDHAMLGTGAAPDRSGILADEWWHPDLHMLLEAVHASNGSIGPSWLEVPGLGDALAAAKTGGEAVDVSLKPRAAILPLGHHGLSIWYDWRTARWRSPTPPAWLAKWNRTHPVSAYFHEVWRPLDAARLARLSGERDDQPGETGWAGLGPTFPHAIGATRSPARAIRATPRGDELVLDLAAHAIDAEHLGHHAAPDLLVISLSAHDFIGHAWGQESWEMWDEELRLDARLARFLAGLDRRIGAGRWAMIATGDHGASPLPEKVDGGRLTAHELATAANKAASAVLGDGKWIDDAHYPTLYFSRAMLAQRPSELASATKRVIAALRAFPGIEDAGRVADVEGRCAARRGRARALCLTFSPARSGEVYYLPARGWIIEGGRKPEATAHGSLHDYDVLVPLIILPPGRVRHAPQDAPLPGQVDMRRVAPMLARWLGIPPPGATR